MTTKTLKFREGDKLITSTVTVENAVIDFQDILDACEIVDDDLCETPWENCDGYEHTATPAHKMPDAANVRGMQGCTYSEWERESVVIQLAKGDVWKVGEFVRERGASRQVAAEANAANRRKTLEQLVKWYRHGWSYYGVKCEYEGAEASVWGVDDYDYADTDVRREMAEDVAAQLEKDGYTVVNRPVDEPRLTARQFTTVLRPGKDGRYASFYELSPHAMSADSWRAEYARNMASQNWE